MTILPKKIDRWCGLLGDFGGEQVKPEETVRRMAERAMGRHRLGAHGLAKAVGCGDTTVRHLLDEETVRLTENSPRKPLALAMG